MVQLQVLNKILGSKDMSIIIENNLDKSFFTEFPNEFTFIYNHYTTYGIVPDVETFVSNFKEFKILDVHEDDNYLLEELYKEKNTRDLAYNFNIVRKLINDRKYDEALEQFKRASETIKQDRVIKPVDIFRDLGRYDEYLDKSTNFGKYFIKTGFDELDAIIGGWDRQEELATIIARSGRGKSWTLLKSAVSATQQGLNVGLYSGEMSLSKVGYRADTLLGHINNSSLIHGNENIKVEYKDYLDKIPSLIGKGSLKVLTPQMINGPAGVSALRTFIEKEKLDILFVDQHSLLEDDRKAKTPVEKASNISKDLKMLQVLEKIPIISVSQMNRTKNEDDSELIDLSQIAQADRIGQDSTLVLGIIRDKNDPNIMKLQIVKSRDGGQVGKLLNYYTDLNLGTMQYIEVEGDTPTSQQDIEDLNARYGDDVF